MTTSLEQQTLPATARGVSLYLHNAHLWGVPQPLVRLRQPRALGLPEALNPPCRLRPKKALPSKRCSPRATAPATAKASGGSVRGRDSPTRRKALSGSDRRGRLGRRCVISRATLRGLFPKHRALLTAHSYKSCQCRHLISEVLSPKELQMLT